MQQTTQNMSRLVQFPPCLLLVMIFVAVDVVAEVTSVIVEEGGFSCGETERFICYSNATTSNGIAQLTPGPPKNETTARFSRERYVNTKGIILLQDPIQVMDLGYEPPKVVSFSVNFSFRIEAPANPSNGDGLAFVLFVKRSTSWIEARGGGHNFGVFSDESPSSQVLAVEFDTWENPGIDDMGNNHVGIDISTSRSLVSRKVDFRFLDTSRVFAWIDYDGESMILEVRVSKTYVKPQAAFIKCTKALYDIFDNPEVWMGFSAANGFGYSFHTIYDLHYTGSFSNDHEVLSPATPGSTEGTDGTGQKSRTHSEGGESNEGRGASSPVSQMAILVPVGVVSVIAIGTVAGLLWWCCLLRQRNGKKSSDDSVQQTKGLKKYQACVLSDNLRMFSYNELKTATKKFSDDMKLGEGSFGSVYRGEIVGTGQLVAVKTVSSESKQGEREFLAELTTIGQLRHRNIVRLLGWCNEGPGLGKFLLVYEFMSNGSLDKMLFKPAGGFVLSWEERFKIMIGVAAALHYLHEGWRRKVIHRDVKSSNIMLDEKLNAMLGDFGLARTGDHQMKPVTTIVAGTYGYIAPESPFTGKFTAKSDVFSFGAVTLEIACGRKVYDPSQPQEAILLVDWVWSHLSNDELLSVVDSKLKGGYSEKQMELVLLLGLLCSHPDPDERPTMHKVLEILGGRVAMPPVPRSKPAIEWESQYSEVFKIPSFLRSPDGSEIELSMASSSSTNQATDTTPSPLSSNC